MGIVVRLQTAIDVWNKLKTTFTILPAPTPSPAPAPAPPVNISYTSTRRKEEGDYIPLCRAIQMGEWEKTQQLLNQDNDALIEKINFYGDTTLHVAVGNPKDIRVLENLLEQINPELLPILVNNKQKNPLHHAALLGNTLAAEKLVEKNPNWLFMVDFRNDMPIDCAVINSHKTTFCFLLQMCIRHIGLCQKDHNPFEGERGVMLLACTINAGFLDIAYDLLRDHPELGAIEVPNFRPPLWSIAIKWDAYPSSQRYNFFQRFVYSHVPIEKRLQDVYKIEDIENQGTYRANPVAKCTKTYVYPVIKRIIAKLWEVALRHVPHIKCLHEDKVKHNLALSILKLICEEVGKLNYGHHNFYFYGEAFIVAVKNNTPEVIKHITRTFPQSIRYLDKNGYEFSQLSILNRCENVYNFLVHEVTHEKFLHNVKRDKDENNLLHLVGRLAPIDKLSMVTGAALQMQRELQWFLEVSKIMRPKDKEAMNKNQETPIMVFRKEHKGLRQEGEE